MPDITKLLARYNELATRANNLDPDGTRIEKMLKSQIRTLALEGGLNGQALEPGNKNLDAKAQAAGKAADFGCPDGWIHCAGGCVPAEVGCEEEQA